MRVDWFTPDGLRTWGDGRLVILGTRGYLDDIQLADVPKFEKALLDHFHTTAKAVWEELAAGKKLTDELDAKLAATIKDFKLGFKTK